MKLFLALLLFFFASNVSGQIDTIITSNESYFSKGEIWQYDRAYIQRNSIKNIKEFRKVSDTLVLISDYCFNRGGFLVEVRNSDIHGNHTTRSKWELDESGNILSRLYYENGEWRLLQPKKHYSKTLISGEDSGVKIIRKKRWLIQRKYDQNDRLIHVRRKKFNKDSLLVKDIFDRRSNVKRSHNRMVKKAPIHIPYIIRYTKKVYTYSKDGDLKRFKWFYNPIVALGKKKFIYSKERILIGMIYHRKKWSDQTWVFKVSQY